MDRPVFAGDNLFSVTQYPLHVIDASEAPLGHDSSFVANGRRSSANYATAITTNLDYWIRAALDRMRAFNYCALDRNHNVGGKPVQLQLSDDNAIWTNVLNLVVPPNTATGSLDDPYGAVTEDGAWLIRFPARTANFVRFYVPAMGAGLAPRIVGLWCGLSYSPLHLYRPHAVDQNVMSVEETVLPSQWRSQSRKYFGRQGSVKLRMADWHEYELARYHLQFVFGAGRPTWIVHDEDQADRAVLAMRPGNSLLGLGRESGANWVYPLGQVDWVEWEPVSG